MKATRIIAGVLAVTTLAAAAVSMHVSAADTVTLTASTYETAAGEAFSIDVSLGDIPSTGVNAIDFALTYDSSALTISSVTIGDAANTDVSGDATATEAPVFTTNILEGEVDVSWTTGLTSDAWISTDGVIVTITGTVNTGTADGTYPIDFAPVDRETYEGSGEANTEIVVGYIYESDAVQYDVTTSAGSVIVSSAVTPTETTTEAPTTTTTTETTTETAASSETTTTTTATTYQTVSPDSSALYGDVNIDGNVTLADSILLNKSVSGVVSLSSQAKLNGDVNIDGDTDSTDALILMKFQVNLVTGLPYTD